MQWTDEGIVIGVKRHGEASAILELMTREHGRHLGLVRGGFGSRMKPILQTGNSVSATWRARLDEHLGNYTVEPLRQRASDFFGAPHAIYGVTHLAALMRLLPERDPHAGLYAEFEALLDRLDQAIARATRPDQAAVAGPIVELPARLAQAALPGPLLVMLGSVFGEQVAEQAVRPVRRHG